MTRLEAGLIIVGEGYRKSNSAPRAKRVYKAWCTLGFNVTDTLKLMRSQEYSDDLLVTITDIAMLPEMPSNEIRDTEDTPHA